MPVLKTCLFFSLLTQASCVVHPQVSSVKKDVPGRTGSYNVFYTTESNAAKQDIWDSANTISPLFAFWENNKPDQSRFQAFYTDRFFYFRFQVQDSAITTFASDIEKTVAKGDRVELFFSTDRSLKNYYCIEMAPNGKVLDYRASYYRKFDDSWHLTGLEIKPLLTAYGYQIIGKIPVDFFYSLDEKTSLTGSSIFAGIFRAEISPGSAPDNFSWYSWIYPDSGTPDFHIGSALGELRF